MRTYPLILLAMGTVTVLLAGTLSLAHVAAQEVIRPGVARANHSRTDAGRRDGAQAEEIASFTDERPLRVLPMRVAPSHGEMPEDRAAAWFARRGTLYEGMGASREWLQFTYNWQASAFCHRPLYFEEINLERLGYSFGVAQPWISAAQFFGTVPILPYKMVVDRPRDCVYTLGHYRPGTYAPFRRERLDVRADAALVEAGAATAMVFILP